MDFSDFITTVTKNIRNYLPSGYEDAFVTTTTGGRTCMTALMIRPKGVSDATMYPVIYLEPFYDRSVDTGEDWEDTLRSIAYEYVTHITAMPPQLAVLRKDYLAARPYIRSRLLSSETHKTYIDQLVSVPVKNTDLVLTFIIDATSIVSSDDESCTIPITQALCKAWGVTTSDIKDAAEKGDVARILRVSSLYDTMMRMCGSAPDDNDNDFPMFIVGSDECRDSASAFLHPTIREGLRMRFSAGYYVLPSSIHETIVVPVGLGMEPEEMVQMVKEINRTQVLPRDRLSDHVYMVDYHGNITIAA